MRPWAPALMLKPAVIYHNGRVLGSWVSSRPVFPSRTSSVHVMWLIRPLCRCSWMHSERWQWLCYLLKASTQSNAQKKFLIVKESSCRVLWNHIVSMCTSITESLIIGFYAILLKFQMDKQWQMHSIKKICYHLNHE